MRVTASFGVTAWRPGDEELEAMIACADEALYQANRVCCDMGPLGSRL